MSTTIPRADSLANRCINYFKKYPDEELSVANIALKFDIEKPNVHTKLKVALDAGLLSRQGSIYSAGTNIHTNIHIVMPDADDTATRPPAHDPFSRTAAAAPEQKTPPRRTRARPTPIDVDPVTIHLDDDVPVPRKRYEKIDWEPLLGRMKVNQSCSLPMASKKTLSAAITARHKAGQGKYTLRTIDAEQLRVWRTD